MTLSKLAKLLGWSVFLILVVGAEYLWKVNSTDSNEPTLRLFLTLTDTRPSDDQGPGGLPSNTLSSAVSEDGYSFTFDPQDWLTSDDMADPAIGVSGDGTWVVASGTGTGSLRIASSEGCPSFDSFPEVFKNGGGIPDVVPFGESFRIYYSDDGGIYSLFSEDGSSFEDEGMIFSLPSGLNLIADPAVTQRADGTYVMYFKGTVQVEKSPYNHSVYRATSEDGLSWTSEDTLFVEHASVPAAYTDADGKVWIYYLNFAEWPDERESVWATYELADGTLAEPRLVSFSPELANYLWVNDPDPILVPGSIELEECE